MDILNKLKTFYINWKYGDVDQDENGRIVLSKRRFVLIRFTWYLIDQVRRNLICKYRGHKWNNDSCERCYFEVPNFIKYR